jgi:uncharacterized protein
MSTDIRNDHNDPVPLGPSSEQARASSIPPALRAAAGAILIALVLALAYYKWGASLRTVLTAQQTGRFDANVGPYVSGGVFSATAAYFRKVWIALLFGILIGGTLRVAVSPSSVAEWLGGRGARSMVVGALTGIPLMLCSCCVTPIFSGLHRRGARLGPSLSVLFAAPGLNLAAIALTFALFPARVGLLRVGAALLLVFAAAPLIGRSFEARRRALGEPETCALASEPQLSWRSLPIRWLQSVGYIALMTLPVVLFGVALSSILLPYMQSLSQGHIALAVMATALLATLVALPSFLEIPLALSLLASGAPAGAAMALLVAGPIVNLPSLLVLAREVNRRVAVSVFLSVWFLASLVGLAYEGFSP